MAFCVPNCAVVAVEAMSPLRSPPVTVIVPIFVRADSAAGDRQRPQRAGVGDVAQHRAAGDFHGPDPA